MKKALLALIVLWASPALAQESYTLNATAGQVTNFINPGRVTHNETQCNAAGLPFTCTEVQIQAVPGFESTRIYPDSLAGREDWIIDVVIGPRVPELRSTNDAWDQQKAELNWCAGDQTFKDAGCAALGLAAGCQLYPCN